MKFIKKIFIICIVIVIISYGGLLFYAYGFDYYKADDSVYVVLDDNSYYVDNYTILEADNNDEVIIFYPGGKVQSAAYLPILDNLRNNGFTCVLVDMPYNLAILGKEEANDVFSLFDSNTSYYMMGHSLGGVVASSYASLNQDLISGLILLGAYNYGEYDYDKTLTIYGEYDNIKDDIEYTTNVEEIKGGNHSNFGNYGLQKNDQESDITSDKQQDQTVELILEFIKKGE